MFASLSVLANCYRCFGSSLADKTRVGNLPESWVRIPCTKQTIRVWPELVTGFVWNEEYAGSSPVTLTLLWSRQAVRHLSLKQVIVGSNPTSTTYGDYGVTVNITRCDRVDTGSIPVSHPNVLVAQLD